MCVIFYSVDSQETYIAMETNRDSGKNTMSNTFIMFNTEDQTFFTGEHFEKSHNTYLVTAETVL